MRFRSSAIFIILLAGVLLAHPVRADGGPPFDPLHQPQSQSPYGMDLMGPGWQWTFPREEAWPRLDGKIRVDLLDEMFRKSWQAGVRSARISTWWCMTEPERDVYRWEDLDYAIQIARNYGMTVVPQIFYTPDWAALGHDVDTPCVTPGYRNLPPQDMNDWSDFMATMTGRYGVTGKDQVHDWEIWNEPDLLEFWYIAEDPWNANVPMYARLVKRARAEVDQYDPGGKLVVGSLSDIYGAKFLKRLMALEGADDIRDDADSISFHLFAEPQRKIDAIKQALGDNKFDLWVTELNSPYWDETVTDQQLQGLYDLLAREGITHSFWFKSYTTKWGPGIFQNADPLWEQESFTPNRFFTIFQNQTLDVQLPAAPQPTGPQQRDPASARPTFAWPRPASGSAPIAGYKLQVDDSLFRDHPYFQSPELDAWVPAGILHFLPLQMVGGGGADQPGGNAMTLPAVSDVTYRAPQALSPGRYYWRVAAVDAQGNVGPYSSPRTIFISVGDERVFLPTLTLP